MDRPAPVDPVAVVEPGARRSRRAHHLRPDRRADPPRRREPDRRIRRVPRRAGHLRVHRDRGPCLRDPDPVHRRVRFGIDEVVTTLLLNPVALLVVNGLLHGPWRDPVTGFPESPRIAAAAEFPALLPGSRLHLGFVIAMAVVAAAWFVLARTPAGLRF